MTMRRFYGSARGSEWLTSEVSGPACYRKRFCTFAVTACILFIGCSRNNGISSGAGGFPASSATPSEVSSSAQVVKVTADPMQSSPGGSAKAIVKLAITSGYHVHANPATHPYLIATEVKAASLEGIDVDKPVYPAAVRQKFEFDPEPLAVYEGNIEIKLPIKVALKATSGERSLPITVRDQAGDTEKCFPPATINATIPIEVK